MRKIVITGGAGFIGSELAWALKLSGHDVFVLDNFSYGYIDNLIRDGKLGIQFKDVDVRSSEIGNFFKNVDTIFHFAGISALPVCQENPSMAYEVNTAAVANVLEQARLHNVRRVIFSSTSAVYENTKGNAYENQPVDPDLVYASSKRMAELICKNYSKNYGMDILVPRFFNVYGPHQDINRQSPPFTSYLIKEIMSDRTPVLFNNTDVQRDYIHVDDVISLLIKMMESDKTFSGDVFNVCSTQGYSVPELVELVQRLAGKQIECTWGDPQDFWNKYPALFQSNATLSRKRIEKEVYKQSIGSNGLARRTFDWSPRIDINAGLSSIINYYNSCEH